MPSSIQPPAKSSAIFIALFCFALALRVPDVWRPIDGTVRDSWREVDVAAIARNFYREGMNLFFPRIDWRGDGPGYVESEFPIYPWSIAVIYRLFGYHEEYLRVASLLLSMAAWCVLVRLARRVLSPHGAIIAALVAALGPLAVRMSTTVHPEPLMYLAYLVAVERFTVWLDTERRAAYLAAMAATALAILAKLPAAHLGVLFAMLCFDRWGWSALRRRDVWLFASVALGVPIAWYWHAHGLWLTYHNSLGMSNESLARVSTFDFLRHFTDVAPGIARLEVQHVWMPTGLLLGAIGLIGTWSRPERRLLLFWTLTLAIYYFITCRTTGELWAVHYHIVSIPLASLLIGAGAEKVLACRPLAERWTPFALAAASIGAVGVALGGLAWALGVPQRVALLAIAAALSILGTGAIALALPRLGWLRLADDVAARVTPLWRAVGAVGLLATTLVAETLLYVRELHPHHFEALYQTAQGFNQRMAPDALIVASGGVSRDKFGQPHAYNAPYFFYWTDHKGFTIADEEQSLEQLEALRARGARYYIAERISLDATPGFDESLRRRYHVLDQRDEAILVELTPAGT